MHSLQKVHRTGTGRGPRAPTGTDSEDSFFTGAGHVYPHLDEAHGRIPYQRPGDLPMGRVSTAYLSPALRAIGMGGRGGPKWAVLAGQPEWQKWVAPKAAGSPTNGPETCP